MVPLSRLEFPSTLLASRWLDNRFSSRCHSPVAKGQCHHQAGQAVGSLVFSVRLLCRLHQDGFLISKLLQHPCPPSPPPLPSPSSLPTPPPPTTLLPSPLPHTHRTPHRNTHNHTTPHQHNHTTHHTTPHHRPHHTTPPPPATRHRHRLPATVRRDRWMPWRSRLARMLRMEAYELMGRSSSA